MASADKLTDYHAIKKWAGKHTARAIVVKGTERDGSSIDVPRVSAGGGAFHKIVSR